MARHRLALALALVVAGAPSALTMCEVVCATHDAQSSHDGSPGHSCHGTPSSEVPTLTGELHLCGHDEELPAAAKLVPQSVPLPLAAVVASIPPLYVDGLHRRTSTSESPPPAHSRRFAPLRI